MPLSRKMGVFFLLFAVLFTGAASAEAVSKGMAEITYESWGSVSSDEKKAAKEYAIKSAISVWASKQGESFLKNYELVRKKVEGNISDYLFGTTLIDENTDKDEKLYRVVLKVSFDDIRIKNLVSSSSGIAQAEDDELSYMVSIFVSRRQSSVQEFDEKVYKRVDTQNDIRGEEHEDVSASGVQLSSSSSQTTKKTTGGSHTKRSDKITYEVSSSNEISTAMNEVFSVNGFEVVEAEYIEDESGGLLSVEAFKQDFSQGEDVSGRTKRNAAKGAKMLEIPYMAVGTLDIGIKDTDPASGLTRVFVTVTGKFISMKKRFPKTIASVGPVQYAGIGPNQSVAERNALKLASTNAATELVNQLNAKGIK